MQKTGVEVIFVTDGDETAQNAIEVAARDLDLFPLKVSGGNPTPLSGPEVLKQILNAPYDPVVVMVDDRGIRGEGPGERVLDYLFQCREELDILGVVAVASDTHASGIRVDCSVTADGKLIKGPVKKDGRGEVFWHRRLEGDTVEILRRYPDVFVVGCGDVGKMHGKDAREWGAGITSRCLQEILDRSVR